MWLEMPYTEATLKRLLALSGNVRATRKRAANSRYRAPSFTFADWFGTGEQLIPFRLI